MSKANSDWDSLVKAKEWVIDTIRSHSNPMPDLHPPLHYVIEATSTYHMPVLKAWGGIPSVINPILAGATKKKTGDLDAERLSCINNIIVRFGITIGRGTCVTKNPQIRAIVEDLASECPSSYENICPDPLPTDIKILVRKEYMLYGKYVTEADSYMSSVRSKVFAMDWETRNGTIPGHEMVRILCTAPGIGEITYFT